MKKNLLLRIKMTCIFLLLLLLGGELFGESARKALVIGNGAYEHTTPLANPVNDAVDIAASLEQFGFAVRLVTDATAGEMEREIRSFTSDVEETPTETALFYYAGHGVQFEGVNYLLPVNADIQETFELLDKAVSIDRVTNGLERSSSTFNLIMLDACRDNPFSTSRSASRGLTVMGAGGSGSMVVFATAPGAVAQDGSGRNSPFTEALLKHIEIPDMEIRNLITEVQRTVSYTTGGKQIPWVNTSFTGEFYFRSAEEQLAKSQTELSELEGELSALEQEIAQREASIASASTYEERQRLELEQQRAKALEEAKRLEAERLAALQKQAEEVLASRAAQDALRAEMEERLSSQRDTLAQQAAQRKAELEELRSQTESTDELRSRLEAIASIYRTIEDIRTRYSEITTNTLAELERLYGEQVSAYKDQNPKDPWETDKEHEARLKVGLDELEAEYTGNKEQQEQDLTARLSEEVTRLEEQLQQAKAELNGKRFTPESEAIAVEVKPFNAEEKRFPISLKVNDASVSYTVPLTYAIESRDREVLRDEYYRVFSAYESNALIGLVEYAVYELEPDVWGVFAVQSEVANLLEDDAVLISGNAPEKNVKIGNPLVLFTAKDQVTTSLPASAQFRDTLLVTGLHPGAIVGNEREVAYAAADRLVLEMEDEQYTLTVESRWLAKSLSLSVNRKEKPNKLVWVDFTSLTSMAGELFIPRSGLDVSVSPSETVAEEPCSAVMPLEEEAGILYKLEPGVYEVSFRLPEDHYDSETAQILIKPGKRYTFDPGEIGLSFLYSQELLGTEQAAVENKLSTIEKELRTIPLQQTAAYTLIGVGAAGIIGSIVSYFKYADAVERYHAAELTEDAIVYRQEAEQWTKLFTVGLGIGIGGGAAGGYLTAITPNRKFNLENEREEIERQIRELNAEEAAREARKARDAFVEENSANLTGKGATGIYSADLLNVQADTEMSIFAKWSKNSNYVTLDSQGGIRRTTTVTATYGEAMPTYTFPHRTGYIFGGYYDKQNGAGNQYYTAAMTSVRNWNKVSDTTLYAKWISPEVGGSGPAGGLIFYDKGSYSNGWRYLEAAPYGWYNEGTDPVASWGGGGWDNPTRIGGTSTKIGSGKANTDKIVAKLGSGAYAAIGCAVYSVTVNGRVYDDWFLPSKDELDIMYENLHKQGKGGFSPSGYWCSSGFSSSTAWKQYFDDGFQIVNSKPDKYRVRAVRAF